MSDTDLTDLRPADLVAAARQRPRTVDPDPAPVRLLIAALVAGVVFDGGIRGGPANAVFVAALACAVVVLVTDRRLEQREARLLAVAAMVPSAFLAVRLSPWLIGSNLLAAVSLVGAAVVFSRSGSLFDTTPLRMLARGVPALARSVGSLASLRSLVPESGSPLRGTVGRVGLAAVLALPILVVLVLLLAAADPVFAGMFLPDLELGSVVGHLVVVAGFAMAVVAVAAAARGDGRDEMESGLFGVAEVVTMLALAAVVLALFVVSQLVALTDAGRRLVETAGMTPADYARSGFFQLCWAAAVLLGLLAVVRRLAQPEVITERAVRIVSAMVPLLALGLVGVSLRRMAYYDAAFGLTMLRLWVVGAALWMGAVLVMLAVRNAGLSTRNWVTGGAAVVAGALLLLANVVNVEAFVARHNLTRADQVSGVDVAYLSTLSDDVVPTIGDALERESGTAREHLAAALRCDEEITGVAMANVSAVRASEVRERHC